REESGRAPSERHSARDRRPGADRSSRLDRSSFVVGLQPTFFSMHTSTPGLRRLSAVCTPGYYMLPFQGNERQGGLGDNPLHLDGIPDRWSPGGFGRSVD
ncbi:MAG: hypothetical protein KGZ25_07215, partial [Planctomycetes bacterium]|nr:hypothetical protein [Planctomycetota bacterium]